MARTNAAFLRPAGSKDTEPVARRGVSHWKGFQVRRALIYWAVFTAGLEHLRRARHPKVVILRDCSIIRAIVFSPGGAFALSHGRKPVESSPDSGGAPLGAIAASAPTQAAGSCPSGANLEIWAGNHGLSPVAKGNRPIRGEIRQAVVLVASGAPQASIWNLPDQ